MDRLARIELMALILKVLAPDSILARDRLARFSAASFTNTGGNGSPREGRGELRGHCALIVSPQFLVAAQKGLPVPFACSETNELGEELVGSYLYQVHLQHWLESNNYDRSGQTATYI